MAFSQHPLLAQAQAWLAQDPDPATRAELQGIIDGGDSAELEARFGSRLGFGTAGLRGELGAGPNRINRVLVAQAAAGIAAWLNGNSAAAVDARGQHPSVVIGYDGRVNSRVFAEDSAVIFAGAGFSVLLFDGFVPTPMLAFAVKRGGYSLGVMVTASHNPPRDNGYKVYLGGANGGSQIISPVDSEMAAAIDVVAAAQTFGEISKSTEFQVGGQELRAAYIERAVDLVGVQDSAVVADWPKTVFTAMHGVGWKPVSAVFAAAGLPLPELVTEQIEPDGNFPTVDFPNPEEPGAMDLAFAKASQVGAELILACDPDADRLAVAVPDGTQPVGWRKLTGDQIGLVLGNWTAERLAAAARTGSGQAGASRSGTLACSIVSSSALGAVAAAHGLPFEQTLTGFKWISKVPNLAFGFEEALGYCLDPQHTPDKDGVTAALVVATIAAKLKAQGSSLEQHLHELGQRYGHFATGQVSLRFASVATAKTMVQALRENPPASIDGSQAAFADLAAGWNGLKPTDGLLFNLADGRRVIIRPSGTEPKLKCYLQAVGESELAAAAGLASLNAAVSLLLK